MSRSGRRFLIRGVYIVGAMLLCGVLAWVVCSALSYDGKCGGFFPGLSARRPCSMWEFLWGDMLAIALIFAVNYWPLVLALLVLPPTVGHWLDRRETPHE